MKDVVMIPAFMRFAFLSLTLDFIKKNPDYRDYHYVFVLDYRYRNSVEEVINRFIRENKVTGTKIKTPATQLHPTMKQSNSLLRGYQKCLELTDGLIFMVEEDIFVSDDFFRWHKTVQNQEPDLFCSIGVGNNNRPVVTEEDPGKYYLTHFDYQSLGVCFKASRLRWIFNTYYSEKYLQTPLAYLLERFPASSVGKMFTEQDGFFKRVQEIHPEMPIAFPHVARGFHAGFYGKSRGSYVTGTLEEKRKKILDICFNIDKMRKVAGPYWKDSLPVELEISEWEKQTRSHQILP